MLRNRVDPNSVPWETRAVQVESFLSDPALILGRPGRRRLGESEDELEPLLQRDRANPNSLFARCLISRKPGVGILVQVSDPSAKTQAAHPSRCFKSEPRGLSVLALDRSSPGLQAECGRFLSRNTWGGAARLPCRSLWSGLKRKTSPAEWRRNAFSAIWPTTADRDARTSNP